MLEELQEKGMTDTTVIIGKGQLHKVNKIRNGGRPMPSSFFLTQKVVVDGSHSRKEWSLESIKERFWPRPAFPGIYKRY